MNNMTSSTSITKENLDFEGTLAQSYADQRWFQKFLRKSHSKDAKQEKVNVWLVWNSVLDNYSGKSPDKK